MTQNKSDEKKHIPNWKVKKSTSEWDKMADEKSKIEQSQIRLLFFVMHKTITNHCRHVCPMVRFISSVTFFFSFVIRNKFIALSGIWIVPEKLKWNEIGFFLCHNQWHDYYWHSRTTCETMETCFFPETIFFCFYTVRVRIAVTTKGQKKNMFKLISRFPA